MIVTTETLTVLHLTDEEVDELRKVLEELRPNVSSNRDILDRMLDEVG